MNRVPPRTRASVWAALLAVALLGWAGVRATVMQAQMAAPAATACADMPGMAMAAAPHAASHVPGKAAPANPARCPFCDAAAHAPVGSAVAPPTAPSLDVAFARYEAPASLGPRGPPARRATARGPPTLSA